MFLITYVYGSKTGVVVKEGMYRVVAGIYAAAVAREVLKRSRPDATGDDDSRPC